MTEAMKYLQFCRKKYGSTDPRTKAAFAARAAEYEAGQTKRPGVWYLSFADGDRFLGGVFIWADAMTAAIQGAHALGINPGGSVLAFPPNANSVLVPEKYRNKLLSKDELDGIDPSMVLARN